MAFQAKGGGEGGGRLNLGRDRSLTGVRLGEWKCKSQLGSGSFGIVHVWENAATGENVAVKKCRFGAEVTLSKKHKDQWRQEVDIMLRLDHSNVVRCREAPAEFIERFVGGEDDLPLLCMEYCTGGDLRKILNLPQSCCGLPQPQVVAIVSDIASALGFLHNRRIIHRDLKPENVVLQETDERTVYKLIDLGYAKELGQSSLALSFVGTLQYIAPELFLSQEYTRSVDYWSLGFITHEIATGHRPFLPTFNPGQWIDHVQNKSRRDICIHQSEPEKEIRNREQLFPENFLSHSLSADLESWLMSLMEWDPGRRGRSPSGDVCVFDELGRMLSKTRLALASMDRAVQKIEYVIEESTSLEQLREWIERDTEVDKGSQLITFASTGREVEPSEPLHWQVAQLREEDRTVFVFDVRPPSGSLKEQIRSLRLNIPPSVAPFLQSPRLEVTYPHKKIVYAHGFYFAKTEQAVCSQLAAGIRVLMRHLLNKVRDLNEASEAIAKNYERARAKFELFKESLKHDVEKYTEQSQRKHRIKSNQIFESWKKSQADVERQIVNISDEMSRAEAAMKRVNAAALDLQKLPKQAKADDLQHYVDKSLRQLEGLKQIPVDGRREKDNVLQVAQLVVKCLKQRDAFLLEHFGQRARIRPIHSELLSLAPLQGMLRHNLEAFSAAVSKYQRRRQTDVWKLVDYAVNEQGHHKSPTPRRSPSSPAAASPAQSPLVGVQESALLFEASSIATRRALEESQINRAHLQEFANKNNLNEFE